MLFRLLMFCSEDAFTSLIESMICDVPPLISLTESVMRCVVWESDDIINRWDPDKNYILVETRVYGDGATYDTMVKDDPRVQWYYV
ncbi:MAG: hypothetical protein J6Y16_11485, partial [Treponema sp.]|nr:hypothetical protein [Treponema sp.]